MPNQVPNQVQVSRIPGSASIPTTLTPGPAMASHLGISRTRFVLSFVVAITSDIISIGTEFVPPVQWIVDGATALLLFLLLGRRWQILPALVAEAVPGLAMLPFWVLVVLTVLAADRKVPSSAATAAPPHA